MAEHEILKKHKDIGKFVVKIVTELVDRGKGDEPDTSKGILDDHNVALALIENDKNFAGLEAQKIAVVTDGNTAYMIGEAKLVLNEAEMRVIVRQAVAEKLSDAERAVVFPKKEES